MDNSLKISTVDLISLVSGLMNLASLRPNEEHQTTFPIRRSIQGSVRPLVQGGFSVVLNIRTKRLEVPRKQPPWGHWRHLAPLFFLLAPVEPLGPVPGTLEPAWTMQFPSWRAALGQRLPSQYDPRFRALLFFSSSLFLPSGSRSPSFTLSFRASVSR